MLLAIIYALIAFQIDTIQMENNNKMETILNNYLNNILPKNDIIIHYHIGNSFVGETDFKISGTGEFELWSTVTKDKKKLKYTGTLNTLEINNVIRSLLETKIWEIKPKRPIPCPDDAEAHITIIADKKEISIKLFVSQIKNEPAFVKIQEEILNLIRKLSDHKILETGN